MTHRPYPNADRARHQVQRHPEARTCPACLHRIGSHAIDDGERVCTRGAGRISCRDCAETWARMPATAAMLDFARVMRSKPMRAPRLLLPLGQR